MTKELVPDLGRNPEFFTATIRLSATGLEIERACRAVEAGRISWVSGWAWSRLGVPSRHAANARLLPIEFDRFHRRNIWLSQAFLVLLS